MRNRTATQVLFNLSQPGRGTVVYPESDVPEVTDIPAVDGRFLGDVPPELPEVAEGDVVRHFVNLSTQNMSVDSHFYPLGSCTMKYNPKRHERLARLDQALNSHPYQPQGQIQGLLRVLYELQQMLAEIAGLPGVSLHPAAGAQGELAALFTAAAYFRDRGENRTRVIFPASAHGTNPASAALAGFECVQLDGSRTGFVDLNDLKSRVDERTAVFMVTNPNTLGLFEKDIAAIADILHDAGGLVYIDGANMNAILGKTRPGDFGGDMMHYNVHKTFTGPHGAGGPGAGPIAVRDFLADFLPSPIVHRDDQTGVYSLKSPSRSIGQVRSFFGNVGILLRGYFYIRTLGAVGLRRVSENAVLNANYLLAKVADVLDVPHGNRCMHEFVASARGMKERTGVTAMDIAKRLLDYGFHAPTVYFPLVVEEAMMMEPTETESLQTLNAFAEAIHAICDEPPELVKGAPHTTPVSRPDEVGAARKPILCWSSPDC
ncbi:MAG: aminomethyl-transferring glycine dehydrogenase subunit GcvPB [Planctomycetaceae bacterium]|nr:aminomethyl-transferring glycine dehydrogenase subunit GcvPB [Planctomycetaceae bacterium]